jgi:hypothetical protein
MSDHDNDNKRPSEEELRDLLRSMPRAQAPESLEPSLMHRIDAMRRRRSLFGVLHTAARADWIGGLLSAATAAAVVAGAWLFVESGGSTAIAPTYVTPAPISKPLESSTPRATARETVARTPQQQLPVRADEPKIAAHAAPARRSSSTLTSSARRRHSTARTPSARASRIVSIDTVAAARLRNAVTVPTLPSSSDAGIRHESPQTLSSPTPSSSDSNAPTGLDTGVRRR